MDVDGIRATENRLTVVVGAPVCRRGAYILDKFLSNQREIQQRYPLSEMALATDEPDFAGEVETLLGSSGVRGRVVRYETVGPPRGGSWYSSIASGREAVRQYILSQTRAKYLMSVDADMLYDTRLVEIMEREIEGYDAVFSGAPLRSVRGTIGMGGGCAMLRRSALERIQFRCVELRNGEVLDDGCMLEMDLIRSGIAVKKGVFVSVNHYIGPAEALSVNPQPLGLFRRISTSRYVRYSLLRASLLLGCDISSELHSAIYESRNTLARLRNRKRSE